jgi:hypothetical protein
MRRLHRSKGTQSNERSPTRSAGRHGDGKSNNELENAGIVLADYWHSPQPNTALPAWPTSGSSTAALSRPAMVNFRMLFSCAARIAGERQEPAQPTLSPWQADCFCSER